MSGFKNFYNEEFLAEIKYLAWIYAQTKHVKNSASDFYDEPIMIKVYVPDEYCGENFDEDISVDLPKGCSEEVLKAYQQGYIRGYHRGIDRIKP